MKKVIFSTNLPSPYRVDFFNQLGKSCDLTVLFERRSSSERDDKWRGSEAINYKEIYLDLELVGPDRSRGNALKEYVKHHISDILIFTNYVSPATMTAIIWCRLHNRKYYIEYDGGFYKKDPFFQRVLKKILLKGAIGHLTTAEQHIRYLKSLGIKSDNIYKYPFTSLTEKSLKSAREKLSLGSDKFKKKLGITEKKIILSIGRFTYQNGYGKGYDILMELANRFGNSVGLYIVGDNPTNEFIEWKRSKRLDNVHFVGFKTKRELAEYYAAADLFILLSRGDVWGLVVNEAMAYGLPVITSDRCIAGLELIKNDINGFVVDLNNKDEIAKSINAILYNNKLHYNMRIKSLEIIRNYTIEKMSEYHLEFFKGNHSLI